MEKDIGKIKKNDIADIIVRVDDFGGRKGLTIREFITGDRYTGFTKAGVRILATDFPKFKEMINSITEEDMKEAPEEQSEEQPEPGQETLDESIKEKEQSPKDEEIEVEKPGEELPDY